MSVRLFPWSSKGKKFFPNIFRLHKHVRACKGYEFLEERRVKVNGVLYEVEMYKPFPLSNPDFLLIKTKEGKLFTTVGGKGYEKVRTCLEKKYFIPKIMRIKKITTTGDEFVWTVSTDRGDTEIRTRGRGSLIRVDGKIFIINTSDDAF
jgi:hypothetical protein